MKLLKFVRFLLLLICAIIVAYGFVGELAKIEALKRTQILHDEKPLVIELPKKADIPYSTQVFAAERLVKFKPLKHIAEKSKKETIITTKENIQIIDRIYRGSHPERMDEYRLWVLLKRLDGVYANKNLSDYDQLIRMYDIIEISIPRPSHETYGCQNILDLLEFGGDCNDYIATFYALLQYYGFGSISMAFGLGFELNIQTNKYEYLTPHAWLDIRFNKYEYSLEPTWYHRYIELPKRGGEQEILEDEFIIRRP